MGQCLSLDQEELKARAKSDVIDRQLQSWAKEEQNVIKILLLGKILTCVLKSDYMSLLKFIILLYTETTVIVVSALH